MIVIVTGCPNYSGDGLAQALEELDAGDRYVLTWVGDCATGAEAIARDWLKSRDQDRRDRALGWSIRFRERIAPDNIENWVVFKRRPNGEADPFNNQNIVDMALWWPSDAPYLCLVAGGDKDACTADLVRRCRDAGIEVREVAR